MVSPRLASLLFVASAVLLSGCGEEWSPESIIEDLRVIGMRAEPAELKPGEAATLSALILDPSRPGAKNTVLWIGCDPDPFNLGRSACSDPAVLGDPSSLVSGGALPPGVHVIGLDDAATYPTDPQLFRLLAPDDARRQSGTVGQVLAIALAKETSGIPSMAELTALFQKVKDKQIKAVITLFRIKVSESATRNTNPKISELRVAGEVQRPGVPARFFPAQKVEVGVDAPDASFEPYVEVTPTTSTDKVERLTSAWYSTSGRFNTLRVALRSEVKAMFTVAGDPEFPRDAVPAKRLGSFYVVMRDTRGGQDWLEQPFWICDITEPESRPTALRSPPSRAELVVLEGTDLSGVLAVEAGGVGLSRGAFNPATGNWEALIPSTLAAGTYPVTVHRKNCRPVATALTLTVP